MSEYRSTRTRDALAECTEEWAKNPVDPLEAVTIFHAKLGALATDYTTYIGTAVTAGGWVRDTSLSGREVIKANTDTALRYADYLNDAGAIDLDLSVDAVALGYIPSWGQNGYLEFWLPIMSRVDLTPSNIAAIRKAMDEFGEQHDMKQFSDPATPHEIRRPLYHAFEKQFVHATNTMGRRPINQILQLVDWELSLGSDVERKYAEDEGIKVETPVFLGSPTDLFEDIKDPKLVLQLERLRALGAVYADFQLTEQDLNRV